MTEKCRKLKQKKREKKREDTMTKRKNLLYIDHTFNRTSNLQK